MRVGRLDFVLPDGRRFRAEGKTAGPVAELHLHSMDVFSRLIREGELGFCDAYLEEQWSTPDLQAFLDLLNSGNDELYRGFPGQSLVRAFERLRHWMNSNTKEQARENISYHYDLGNEFYALWLDDTMTYSSALFETGQESLEAAQRAKYGAMVDQLGAASGRSRFGNRLWLGRVRRICRQGVRAAGDRADHQRRTVEVCAGTN